MKSRTLLTACALAFFVVAGPALARSASEPAPAGSAVSLVERISMEEVSQEMARRLSALPGVRGVERLDGQVNSLRVVTHSDVSVRLDTLQARVNLPDANPEAEYSRFENNVRNLLERQDPFKLDQLRIVIRTTEAINTFEEQTAVLGDRNVLVRRPFAEGLEEVVVGDTPTAIAFMPIGRLSDLHLGATQAFDRARANTLKELTGVKWTVNDGLLEADPDQPYATSLLALDQVWATLQKQLGGPLAVAVPTRDLLVVGRADRARDMTRLATIAASGADNTGKLSGRVLVRQGAVWVAR
ncbi:MAG: hypothetical protein CFE32_11580 [Alphaproteobacteria bacterium PA3]|nr:MAG: hypothetical protein CFE32_11580 [Alphaproteobacteria bacterium PA3]